MGKNYCAVKDCHNVSGRIGRFGKPVKLHELPKKQHLRTAWLRAISRKHFNPKRTQVRISLSKLEAHTNRRHLTCYKKTHFPQQIRPTSMLPPPSLSLSKCLLIMNFFIEFRCILTTSLKEMEGLGTTKFQPFSFLTRQ